MARFFLHIEYTGTESVDDCDGSEFSNLEAAMQEAEVSLRELLSTVIREKRMSAPNRIRVADADGLEIGFVTADQIIPWLRHLRR